MLAGIPWTWAGRTPINEAIQANLAAADRCRRQGGGQIVLFEPEAPVFTLGRRAATPAGRDALETTIAHCRERDIGVITVDRGGLGTLHLPGQLVCFIAWPCRRSQVPALIDRLLAAACEMALEFELEATIEGDDRIGVWLPEGKLASIGLRLDRGVVCHGMAINVAVDRGLARGLSLCGTSHTRLANLCFATSRGADGGPSGVLSVAAAARRLAAALHLKLR